MEGRKYRVLLCEDDTNLGMVLKNYLELNDYEVVLERDGRLGFAAFQREKFDICLLDVMMPHVDGFTLANDIRDIDPDVPLFFLSAKTEFDMGGYHFNPKLRQLIINGNIQVLSPKENDLLKMLAEHKNDLLSREKALKRIWGSDTYFNGRSMDVYIAKLRKYLKEDPKIEIVNIHGNGFRLVAP